MSKVVETVTELARPIAEKNGCELWDVEYVNKGGARYLRVYIDRDGGVSIDDCEAVSRQLDPILDKVDLLSESYTFEVSSAGAERALKRPGDFERFMGSLVSVKLYRARDGKKEYSGRLVSYDGGKVGIDTGKAGLVFEKSEVAFVRLKIEF